MRNAWKTLFIRSFSRISAQSSRIESINFQVRLPNPPNHSLLPLFLGQHAPGNPRFRYFSSEPALERKDHYHDYLLVAEIFSKPIGSDEIKTELESVNLTLDNEIVNSVLWNLEGSPEIAQRFFNWVSEKENRKLSSKSYNLMLRVLGRKDRSEEFWGLVEIMKKKGYGISKGTYLRVSERFDKEGMERDFNLLKEMYFLNSPGNVVGRMCPWFCKILREEDEVSENIQKKLEALGFSLSSDLVLAVLERSSSYPSKALMFLRWAEGNPSVKIDGRIYNVMARILGREDCIEDFWHVVNEMRNGGYEMEKETYVDVSGRFYKRKMVTEAVDLYDFAMGGSEKPSAQDFLFLLRKIVVSKDPDMGLISRVVSIFVNAGNVVKGSTFDSVLKSLSSVGKLEECGIILKAMEEGGFVANSAAHDSVVIGLCNARRMDKACEYVDEVEKSGNNIDLKTWQSLVQRLSLAGEVDKALLCFSKMVERKGAKNAGCSFEVLVNGFCKKKTAVDAFKILTELVTEKQLQPWHSTYKFLIERLLSQGNLKEASGLLGLMKTHGFPPFIDPFIDYISRSGTGDDAMSFLKAMTVKEFPSTTVFLRMFEAFLKEGRHEVAHELLYKSPGYVRNHADVLDLFCSMKLDETATATAI